MGKLPKITVLYEDVDCVVVNKPAGLMVHSDGRSPGPFLTDWVLKEYPKAEKVGEPARDTTGAPIARPGIVHRLDRETSGALVIAKTKKGHAHLKEQFQERTVTKKYLAFAWGEMLEEFGTIKRPIGRSGSDFRKWSAQRGARGDMRDAESYWTRIANSSSEVEGRTEKFTLLEVEPKTGRTHQIRVHLLAVHHPVVGDVLYVPKRPMALGFERTALHARSISFLNTKGEKVTVVAPLPDDFRNAYEIFGLKLPIEPSVKPKVVKKTKTVSAKKAKKA